MARWAGLLVAAAIAATLLAVAVFAGQRSSRDDATTVAQWTALWSASHIGVDMREVTPEDVSKLKLQGQSGAVVTGVEPDSPAAKAGVHTGDVIVEFDGERVRSTSELARLVRETPGGRTVKMAVVRDGRRTDLSVTPAAGGMPGIDGERLQREIRRGLRGVDPDQLREEIERGLESARPWLYQSPEVPGQPRIYPPPPGTPFAPPLNRAPARLGVTIEDLTDQLADYFGVKDGVLVRSVIKDSAAGRAGIRAGDVITTVAGQTIHSAADVSRALRDFKTGDEVEIGFVRDRKSQTIKLRLDPPYRVRPAVELRRRGVVTSSEADSPGA